MTNLQSLSIFLTERLMLAAQEIFKAVEVTVTEYHDEISRSRQENELLKTRLLEAGIQLYPESQPGPSVFHGDPCAGSERGDPGEKIQVKQEPSATREEPRVPPPQTSVPEEPISPRACLEDEQRLEELLHPHMTDISPSPLLNSHQCMQIKEESDDLKSGVGAEIFCASQSCTSDDPSSSLASNNAIELETELDSLSSMHNASEMPLGCNDKSAHHRQRLNTDPIARAEYLAKRKESYQKRKQLGKIKYVKSRDLPKHERKKQRAQWRAASKNYRLRKRLANPGFDLIPPSMELMPSLREELSLTSRVNAGQPKRCITHDAAEQDKELQRSERYPMIRARGIGKLPKVGRERKTEPMMENQRAFTKKERLPDVLMLAEEQCMPRQLCLGTGSINERNIQHGNKPSAIYQSEHEANLCVVCGRSFSSRGLLKVHLRVHSGERPYHCPYCDKNFRQSSHLSVHIRIHTGEKPYSCLSCGKRFSDRSACNRHVKAHLEYAELSHPS